MPGTVAHRVSRCVPRLLFGKKPSPERAGGTNFTPGRATQRSVPLSSFPPLLNTRAVVRLPDQTCPVPTSLTAIPQAFGPPEFVFFLMQFINFLFYRRPHALTGFFLFRFSPSIHPVASSLLIIISWALP